MQENQSKKHSPPFLSILKASGKNILAGGLFAVRGRQRLIYHTRGKLWISVAGKKEEGGDVFILVGCSYEAAVVRRQIGCLLQCPGRRQRSPIRLRGNPLGRLNGREEEDPFILRSTGALIESWA